MDHGLGGCKNVYRSEKTSEQKNRFSIRADLIMEGEEVIKSLWYVVFENRLRQQSMSTRTVGDNQSG